MSSAPQCFPFPVEDLTAMARTNVIVRGSFIPIWAAVEQGDHQPLLLLMDECVAALTAELQPETQVYPIVTNHGFVAGPGLEGQTACAL